MTVESIYSMRAKPVDDGPVYGPNSYLGSWSSAGLDSEPTGHQSEAIGHQSEAIGYQSEATTMAYKSDEDSSELKDSPPIPTCTDYGIVEMRHIAAGSEHIMPPAIPAARALPEDSSHQAPPAIVIDLAQDRDISPSDSLPPNVAGSALELPARVREVFNPQNPGGRIHSKYAPSAVRTALCDNCNKFNKSIIQRCQDCNLQFCEPCIKNGKVTGNHVAEYKDMEWEDVGPNLKPPSRTRPLKRKAPCVCGRRTVRSKKRKIDKRESPLENSPSRSLSRSLPLSPTTRNVTRASIGAGAPPNRWQRKRRAPQNKSFADLQDWYANDDDDECADRGCPTDKEPADGDGFFKKPKGHLHHATAPSYRPPGSDDGRDNLASMLKHETPEVKTQKSLDDRGQ